MLQGAGLWRDGWFYVSLFGLMASAALFVYFLDQYRASTAEENMEPRPSTPSSRPAETSRQPDNEPLPSPKPILARPNVPQNEKGKALSLEKPAPEPGPEPSSRPEEEIKAPAETRRDPPSALSGELGAALRELAGNFGRLEGEVSSLKSLVSQMAPEKDLLIGLVSEIKEKLQSAPTPAPKETDPQQTTRALGFIEELLQKMRGFEGELSAIKTLVSQARNPQSEGPAKTASSPAAGAPAAGQGNEPAAEQDPAGRRRPVWPV